jgi:signal transduction histidine kinase
VKDSGIGISEEDLARLFKFFGQASNSKKINKNGMGLGLTISKMII